MASDLYSLLDCPRDADEATLKKAWKKAARTCHPDIVGDGPEHRERFKTLSRAFEVLSNPLYRQFYDLVGADPEVLGLDDDTVRSTLAEAAGPVGPVGRKPKVPRATCPTCNGTGLRPSGRICTDCDPRLRPVPPGYEDEFVAVPHGRVRVRKEQPRVDPADNPAAGMGRGPSPRRPAPSRSGMFRAGSVGEVGRGSAEAAGFQTGSFDFRGPGPGSDPPPVHPSFDRGANSRGSTTPGGGTQGDFSGLDAPKPPPEPEAPAGPPIGSASDWVKEKGRAPKAPADRSEAAREAEERVKRALEEYLRTGVAPVAEDPPPPPVVEPEEVPYRAPSWARPEEPDAADPPPVAVRSVGVASGGVGPAVPPRPPAAPGGVPVEVEAPRSPAPPRNPEPPVEAPKASEVPERKLAWEAAKRARAHAAREVQDAQERLQEALEAEEYSRQWRIVAEKRLAEAQAGEQRAMLWVASAGQAAAADQAAEILAKAATEGAAQRAEGRPATQGAAAPEAPAPTPWGAQGSVNPVPPDAPEPSPWGRPGSAPGGLGRDSWKSPLDGAAPDGPTGESGGQPGWRRFRLGHGPRPEKKK